MHPLSGFAADIAHHVDRLVIAVHRQMRAVHRTDVERWRDATGVDQPGLLLNLRPFFLAGQQSRHMFARLHRYALPDFLETSITDANAAGLVDHDLNPSEKCLALSRQLTDLQSSLMDELWREEKGLSELVAPLARAVDGVADRYPGPNFDLARGWAELPRPDLAGPFLVHHLLTALRYLRADSHSVVLDAAGLTASEAARLDAVWRKLENTHNDHPLAGLVAHGFVTPEGEITPNGLHARQGIEDETNSVSAAVWESVDRDLLPGLLQGLAGLPDHVQR